MIKDLDYIRFADCAEDIGRVYGEIARTEHRFDNTHLEYYYRKLAQDICNML